MFDLMHYSEAEKNEIIASMTILIDTREHEGKHDHILSVLNEKNIAYKNKKLDYGDYSFMIPANEKHGIQKPLYFDRKIAIERKANLDEFCSNISTDRERLKREFALMPPIKVLLIENATYGKMMSGDYRSEYPAKSLAATIHSFWHEFNLPVFFIENKKYTGNFIINYFGYYLKKYMQ